ncbi:periplasmic binding protein-like I [Catenaria anguillulae PL171]|uniref:Periplasmic binding protein-like I n=1 Tax=Catenaria anguillulae PL171 TaxID=765915 RepID=A0A1Y2HLT2_9FUNG|nr:periplasmic binding protein-like I [Catenaria anguillulae PL171]
MNNQVARPAGHSVFIDIRDTSTLSAGATHIFNSTLPALAPNATTTPTNGAIAMIAGITSDTTIPLTLLAQAHGMYVCSGSATATKLSNTSIFGQSFFRTIPADDIQGIALAYYLAHQQWTACAVIASNSKYGRSIASAFSATATELAIDIASTEFVAFGAPAATKPALLARAVNATAQTGVRVVVFFGTMPEYLDLAPVARQAGILGVPNWVWIASEAVGEITLAVERDPNLRAVTDGLQVVFPEEVVDKQMEQRLLVRARGNDNNNNNGGNADSRPRGPTQLEPYAGFFRDCLFGLTTMFVDMLKPGTSGTREADVLNRRANVPVRRALRPFVGITGKVEFDAEGKRKSAFNVLSLFGGNATAVYRIDTGSNTSGETSTGRVTELAKPRYFGGSTVRPPARPEDIVQFVRYRSVAGVFVVGVTGYKLRWWWWGGRPSWPGIGKHAVVKEHKLSVLILVSIGVLTVLGGTLGWMDVQSVTTCNTTKWTISMGFQLIVIPLLYRSYLVRPELSHMYPSIIHTLTLG